MKQDTLKTDLQNKPDTRVPRSCHNLPEKKNNTAVNNQGQKKNTQFISEAKTTKTYLEQTTCFFKNFQIQEITTR